MKLEIKTYIMRDSLGDLPDEEFEDLAEDFGEFLRQRWFDDLGRLPSGMFKNIEINVITSDCVGVAPDDEINIIYDDDDIGDLKLRERVEAVLTDANGIWSNYWDMKNNEE